VVTPDHRLRLPRLGEELSSYSRTCGSGSACEPARDPLLHLFQLSRGNLHDHALVIPQWIN
jgi:hypothetical protein